MRASSAVGDTVDVDRRVGSVKAFKENPTGLTYVSQMVGALSVYGEPAASSCQVVRCWLDHSAESSYRGTLCRPPRANPPASLAVKHDEDARGGKGVLRPPQCVFEAVVPGDASRRRPSALVGVPPVTI